MLIYFLCDNDLLLSSINFQLISNNNSSETYLLCKAFCVSLANVAFCTSSLQPGSQDSVQQLGMIV